jgi:hypothetical protein
MELTPSFFSPDTLTLVPQKEPKSEISHANAKIQDAAKRQLIEMRIVDHLKLNIKNIQIDESLTPEATIQACQKYFNTIEVIKTVFAVIFPIKLKKMTLGHHITSQENFCLIHQNLPSNLKQMIQTKYHISSNLMKGVLNACHVAFGTDIFFRFNFSQDPKDDIFRIPVDHNRFIWHLDSLQVNALQDQLINEESVLNKRWPATPYLFNV